jgi:hypothetical protein
MDAPEKNDISRSTAQKRSNPLKKGSKPSAKVSELNLENSHLLAGKVERATTVHNLLNLFCWSLLTSTKVFIYI